MADTLATEVLSNLSCDGPVILPASKDYDAARRVWNGVADKRPAAVVRALTTADVVKTIAAARSAALPLAVRGGGHSLPGLSTCDGGIVLDLSLMNGITVDPTARIARVSGGALLGDLDRAGIPHGLVVPAGVVSHTGAAGLTLGGGMGWLSRRYGLTIDSLKSVDLVTADGTEIHASAESEPELFWGLRGGGGNFGVATRFTFAMHELGPVFSGSWKYPAGAGKQVLAAYHAAAAAAPRELTTTLNLSNPWFHVTALWSGAGRDADRVLAPFGQLAPGAEGSHGPADFLAHQSRYDEWSRWGRRYYAKGGFFGPLTPQVIAALTEVAASAPSEDCEIYMIQLGGAVSDVPDSTTAYTGRAAQYYWIVSGGWDDPALDARNIPWGRDMARKLAALSMSGNYVNEQGDTGGDIAVSAYGGEKYRRLQKLKARFDPTNLFRFNQNIEPMA